MCKHEFRSDYSKWYLFSTKYMSVFSPSLCCEIDLTGTTQTIVMCTKTSDKTVIKIYIYFWICRMRNHKKICAVMLYYTLWPLSWNL